MKLNLSQPLLDHDGVIMRRIDPPIRQGDLPKDLGELLLSHALFAAVNSTFRDEQIAPDELYKRGRLAKKVKDTGEKNFSSEEIQLMLSSVAKRYGQPGQGDPLFVLKVSEILDPDKFKTEGAA